jgi:Family of unknown function (DUF6338)
VPASLQAAVVFAVLIVPGLLITRAYRRTRAHTLPDRDLYALAQAVTVSLAWLPVVWVIGGHTVLDWVGAHAADKHQGAILTIVAVNLLVSMVAGLIAGKLVDLVASWDWALRALGWTGLFAPPTAWEAAWFYASQANWAAVEISLRSGERFNVLYDKASTVGVSPAPRRAFFNMEYRYGDNEEIEFENHEGIYIDATEVVSIRFEYLDRPSE